MWDTLKARRLTESISQDTRMIDISKDVTFDEDTAYNKSKKRPAEEPEEAPIIHDTTMNEETQEEDREFEEP